MKIQIINGPNLNLLGIREPDKYGGIPFEEYFKRLIHINSGVELHSFQSNSEGEIIDKLHSTGFTFDGIILNAGAYTHTSIAIADAISSISTPVVEVHISNVYAREDFRHKSFISKVAKGIIIGCGIEGYNLAVQYLKSLTTVQ